MARHATDKLTALKRAFTEDAMLPTQAAQAVGVSYATAKRYYDLWSDEIRRSLEARMIDYWFEKRTRIGPPNSDRSCWKLT